MILIFYTYGDRKQLLIYSDIFIGRKRNNDAYKAIIFDNEWCTFNYYLNESYDEFVEWFLK